MKLSHIDHLLCIGMPVADVLIGKAQAGDLMQRYGMKPAVRNMLNAQQIAAMEAELATVTDGVDVVAGGSLANTASAVARLSPDVAITFCAASAKDAYGEIFSNAILDADMDLIPEACMGTETSRSYVLTDSTGERAVARYLGDSMSSLTAGMIEADIENADMVLLEGELPALPNGYALWRDVLALAAKYGVAVGFTLFGAEQVQKHRTLFMETIEHHAAYVFGNEEEIKALFGETFEGYDQACDTLYALMQARLDDAVLCISHGSGAPYLRTRNGVYQSAPAPVARVINTLGAGDAFMAGVFAGLLNDAGEEASLSLGHRAAAAVISQEEPQLSEAALHALKAA
jgi:sugar/nucleoside kinase (ribokinase family)